MLAKYLSFIYFTLTMLVTLFSFNTLAKNLEVVETEKAQANTVKGASTNTAVSQTKTVDIEKVQERLTADVSASELLQALMLEQGEGSFTQKKHFKFLTIPISSTGHFIVKNKAVLWQTKSPVFSELLIKDSAIYQRLAAKDEYQLLVDNAEFSSLLSTLFTGKINLEQWQVAENVSLIDDVNLNTAKYCLVLQPKAKQLQQLFQRVDLCLPSLSNKSAVGGGVSHFDLDKRYIYSFDQQGNKTQISMQINSRRLTIEQAQALTVNLNASYENNEQDTNKASVNAH